MCAGSSPLAFRHREGSPEGGRKMKIWTIAAGICVLLASGSARAADFGCEGKNFVFFPGGAEGDSFASIVYAGAKLAAQQTGCHVDYVWSDWNPQKMVQQLS